MVRFVMRATFALWRRESSERWIPRGGSPRRPGSRVGRRALSSRVMMGSANSSESHRTYQDVGLEADERGTIVRVRMKATFDLWRRDSSAGDRKQLSFLSMPDGSHIQCDIRSHGNHRCPKQAAVVFTFGDAGVRPRSVCVQHAPPMRDALMKHLTRRDWWESPLS